jgi:alkylation response protein AidB-like acyl-CoA dehydrogenase
MYLDMTFAEADWPERTIAALSEVAVAHHDGLEGARRELRFPRDVYGEMGKRGLIGPLTPAQGGGQHLGASEYCLISEEIGRLGLVSVQTAVQGQQWLGAWGTPEQKDMYLRGLADGTLVFAEAISEPDAGSSFSAIRTNAVRNSKGWVITGAKTHVNLGAEADLLIVYAQTSDGLSAFLVEAGTPGLSATHSDPIGLRLIPTADVILDQVQIGPDAILGGPGDGLKTFLTTFNLSRLGNASELIGLARRGLSLAIDYARAREVGKSVVTDFQGIRWTIADCHQAILAASALRDHAARTIAAGNDPAFETSVAKSAAIDAAQKVIEDCFALIGGHGLYHTQPYLALLGDIYVLRTAGGSREVLRNYAARRILESNTYEGLR